VKHRVALAFAVVFPAFAVSALLFVRVVLGFRAPVPWPDETWFVVPAYRLATAGTLFDQTLNPDRVVM
jgi:hypothetical protein